VGREFISNLLGSALWWYWETNAGNMKAKLERKNKYFISNKCNTFFINVYELNGLTLLWARCTLSFPKKKILCMFYTAINMAFSMIAPQTRYRMLIVDYQWPQTVNNVVSCIHNYCCTNNTQRAKNKQLLQHCSRLAGLPTISYHWTRTLGTSGFSLPAGTKTTFILTNWRYWRRTVLCQHTVHNYGS
jgi:hypothetical protein